MPPSSRRPSLLLPPLVVLVLVTGLVFGVFGVGACDRPCDELQKRLETCAAKEPLAETYRDPRVRQVIERRCRLAVPKRVRACLREKECTKLSACAAKAFSEPEPSRAPGSERQP